MRISRLSLGALSEGERDGWRSLSAGGQREALFVTPEWLLPWTRTLGAAWTPLVLAVENLGELVALAPFGRAPSSPGMPTTISFLGTGCSDYLGPLARPDLGKTSVERMLEALVADWADWTLLDLPGLRLDSPALPWLTQAMHSLGLEFALLPGYACPELEIRGDWDAYLFGRGRDFRSWLNRKWRRLERLGAVQVRHLHDAQEVSGALPQVRELHRARWRGRFTSSHFSATEPGRRFYFDALTAYAASGWADLALLEVDGAPLAAAVSFVRGGVYAYYTPVHHPGADDFSPGTLILANLVERAHRLRCSTFDFMLGDEPYKFRWATRSTSTVRLLAARPRRDARLTLRLTASRHRLRSWLRAQPNVRRARERLGFILRYC